MQSSSITSSFTTVKRLPEKNRRIATVLAFFLIPLSGLITDIYLPSMPHMAADLHQPEGAIQFTLTLFLVSYGVAQFVTGSLIDSFGRYRLTLISLILFVLSNLLIAVTDDIYWIYAMRIVQGIATGFIVVSKRAFFVDVYKGDERKHYLSMMSIVWSSAPVLAPFIGGYLQKYFNWQANFYVLAGYGLVMLLLEWIFSGETNPVWRRFHLSSLLNDYKTMLRSRVFVKGLLICGFCYGTTMLFALSGAFIIEHKMGYSEVVAGYASLWMGLAWMAGGFLGKATLNRPLLPKLKLANLLHVAFALLMVGSAFYISNLMSLLAFAFLIHMCVGFIFNNYFAVCLGYFPDMAGLTSGMSGGSVFIITSVTSYAMVGLFHPKMQPELGLTYTIMALLITAILHVFLNKKLKNG